MLAFGEIGNLKLHEITEGKSVTSTLALASDLPKPVNPKVFNFICLLSESTVLSWCLFSGSCIEWLGRFKLCALETGNFKLLCLQRRKDFKLVAPSCFLVAFPIFILIALPPPPISIYTASSGNFFFSVKLL